MLTRATVTAALILFAIIAPAHHSNSAFELDRVVAFQGTVVRYQWKNPHVYLEIEDANGVEWLIETDATPIMRRSGWARDSFTPGDIVSVRANPDKRSEKKHGLLLSIEGSDSVVMVSMNKTRGTNVTESVVGATSLAGVWTGKRSGRRDFWLAHKEHPLTLKGDAAVATYDESMSPIVECIPIPTPWILALADLYLSEIELQEDIIVIRSEFYDTERTIYTDGRKHPESRERTTLGHSIGSWDGDTLVVDTIDFADSRSPFPQTGRPSGAQKHVVERFALSGDGSQLLIDVVLDDPEYLAKPMTAQLVWHHSPHLEMHKFDCERDVAQRFLQ